MNHDTGCNSSDATCFEGRGACDVSALDCVCTPPYVSRGDLSRMTECSVHYEASKAIWGVTAALWLVNFVGCVVAMRFVKRKTNLAFQYEVLSLCMIFTTSVNMSIVGILEAITTGQGQRSIGIDTLTTVLFGIGNTSNWIFIVMSPLNKSGNGVSPFALERTRKLKKMYAVLFPLLVLLAVAGSFIPLGVLTARDYATEDIHRKGFFITFGVILMLTSSFVVRTLYSVRRDFRHALNAMQVDPVQASSQKRIALDRLVRRTNKLLLISSFALIIIGPLLFYIAFFPSLSYATWIVLPVIISFSALWTHRYIWASYLISRIATRTAREPLDSGSLKGANIRIIDADELANGLEYATDASRDSTQNPSKSRKRFRLMGLKPKPLQQMSIVQEGEYEGTVQHTYNPDEEAHIANVAI